MTWLSFDGLLDSGMTIVAVAEELRVDDRRVVWALDAAGIPRRPPDPKTAPVTAPELQDELWRRRPDEQGIRVKSVPGPFWMPPIL
jgi:hypothetical protein